MMTWICSRRCGQEHSHPNGLSVVTGVFDPFSVYVQLTVRSLAFLSLLRLQRGDIRN